MYFLLAHLELQDSDQYNQDQQDHTGCASLTRLTIAESVIVNVVNQSVGGVQRATTGHYTDTIEYLKGSDNNDNYYMENGVLKTETNRCGGILGGITNGMPLIFSAAFKATPSISCTQSSVSVKKMEQIPLNVKGRHDPCIVPRAVPVIEAAAAIAIYDMILGNTMTNRRK